MINIASAETGARLLDALGEQLAALNAHYELVVVGGSALLALGLIDRPTQDVDLVALRDRLGLAPIEPLPRTLVIARDRVARDFQLPEKWLNAGPAQLLDLGLPDGFLDRAERRQHGPNLAVWYASRYDQIHLKLYAAVDQGPGKHEADLRALAPTADELVAAAEWSRSHDPSEGYLDQLRLALAALGVDDASFGP